MAEVGEFTVVRTYSKLPGLFADMHTWSVSMEPLQANIAMDEDKKEEQKKADVDRSKLEADIKAQTDLAGKVRVNTTATRVCLCNYSF